MLHILNGDSTRLILEQTDVPGQIAVWTDVLHEGPVPYDEDVDAWIRLRARYLASNGWSSEPAILSSYRTAQSAFDSWSDHDEIVLWFEHDLYDQLLLIRHLAWWRRANRGATRLSLICIGEYPGMEDFAGLGQLSPAQLAGLLDGRIPVSDEQFDQAGAAWKAFTSKQPLAVQALIDQKRQPLPYLAGALQRILEEYPATGNGLPRTERQILEALEPAPLRVVTLFRANQTKEERVFMGDSTFWLHVLGLADGDNPLIAIEAGAGSGNVSDPSSTSADGRGNGAGASPASDDDDPTHEVRLTPKGRGVLEGRADWIELNGIDRWIGGVHLHGADSPWRWDRNRGVLVAAS